MIGAKCLRIKGSLLLDFDFYYFWLKFCFCKRNRNLKFCISNAPLVTDFRMVGQYTSNGIKTFVKYLEKDRGQGIVYTLVVLKLINRQFDSLSRELYESRLVRGPFESSLSPGPF